MARKKQSSGVSGCGCLLLGVLGIASLAFLDDIGGTPAIVLGTIVVLLLLYALGNDPKKNEERLLQEAAAIKANAKRQRDIASAREIVAAHRSGSFSLDQTSVGRYPGDWDSIRTSALTRDGYRCGNCGASGPDVALHVHHIVPLSRGGSNQLSNLRTLCNACHRQVHS
jgi:hypothetical protein